MRVAVVILTLPMLLGALTPNATAACLHFEPSIESIAGTLVARTYPGPPNYESVENGDEPETGWYVQLAKPICLAGTPGDELNSEDTTDVSLVQLVLQHGEYKTHSELLGGTVKATGTFFSAQTGHHHTAVLLQVTTLEAVR